MLRLLVIGYGNTLRGDDAFGFRAAEQLRECFTDPEVEVLALHQLGPELMEPVSRAGRVVFLDASVLGTPGELRCEKVEPATEAPAEAFTHHVTPASLLAGARAIYGRAPEAVLYTVAGSGFEFGTEMSPAVAAAVTQVVALLAGGSR